MNTPILRASLSHQLVSALLAGLLCAACNEKPAAPVTITPPPKPVRQPQAETPPAPEAPAPPVTLKEFQASPEFADMNTLVDAFMDKNKRPPTMAELTRSFGRPLPALPPGHMFVIDGQARKVKVVPVN